MSVSVTQTYGIELQSLENGAFTCPSLFASRCRAWAQATFAKQVGAQITAKRSLRFDCESQSLSWATKTHPF
jgi:hypothetical protein